MQFLQQHGIEPERIRLSQSAAFEPLTTRLESAWQDENNCVEVFLLTAVVERSARHVTRSAKPVAPKAPYAAADSGHGAE